MLRTPLPSSWPHKPWGRTSTPCRETLACLASSPLVRVSMGDPDIAHDDDGGAVVTPGLMFYLGGKNKIGANVDIYSPQSGNTECSFKVQMFLYFYRAVRSPPGTSAPPQGAYDVRGPVCTR